MDNRNELSEEFNKFIDEFMGNDDVMTFDDVIDEMSSSKKPLVYYLFNEPDELSDEEISDILSTYLYENNLQGLDEGSIQRVLKSETKNIARAFSVRRTDILFRIFVSQVGLAVSVLLFWGVFFGNLLGCLLYAILGEILVMRKAYPIYYKGSLLAQKILDKIEVVEKISRNLDHYLYDPMEEQRRFLPMCINATAERPQ